VLLPCRARVNALRQPRQAAVLAYIGSLVLRSLKAVDYDLDRFDEESEDISVESDDESREEPANEPPAEPVAANPVGPGKEPLPPWPRSSSSKSSTASPTDLGVCATRSLCRGAALLHRSLPRCRRPEPKSLRREAVPASLGLSPSRAPQ
jgi:hypothetical protein